MNLQRAVSVLQTYGGRDKAIRTAYYAFVFVIGRLDSKSELADKLRALAKQLSSARLIGRRFNDLPMLYSDVVQFGQSLHNVKDQPSYILQSVVNILYTLYHPIEHIAWLADLQLINVDSSRFWRCCVWIWVLALTCTIVRSLRLYIQVATKRAALSDQRSPEARELFLEQNEHLYTVVQNCCDFMNAINSLPKGILWAQTLPPWKTGVYGFLASFMGLYRLYKSTK